jgi:hypothetical protein
METAYQSKLQVGITTSGSSGSSLAFQDIGGITDFSGPNLSRDAIESATHQSPDGYKQKAPGLRDPGDVSFTVEWDQSDTTHVGTNSLLDQFNDDDIYPYRIVYPEDPTEGWQFDGFLTKYSGAKAPVNGKLEADMTITLAGKPDWGTFDA